MKIVSVVKARIQTVEDIYCLVWTAVANRRPIGASYHGFPRLFCPHRLGRNNDGELRVFVLSVRRRKRERAGGGGFTGQLALHCAGEAQASEFVAG